MYEILIPLISFVVIYELWISYIYGWYQSLLLPKLAVPMAFIIIFSIINLLLLYPQSRELSRVCRPYCPYLKVISLIHALGYMLWMVMLFGEHSIQTSIYLGIMVLIFAVWQALLSWDVNRIISILLLYNIIWYIYLIVLTWNVLRTN